MSSGCARVRPCILGLRDWHLRWAGRSYAVPPWWETVYRLYTRIGWECIQPMDWGWCVGLGAVASYAAWGSAKKWHARMKGCDRGDIIGLGSVGMQDGRWEERKKGKRKTEKGKRRWTGKLGRIRFVGLLFFLREWVLSSNNNGEMKVSIRRSLS